MGSTKKEIKVIGSVSLDEALKGFALSSEKNKKVLDRVNRINQLIDEIVEERNFLGYSQRELAELSGIKQPMIARFEKAEMMPRIDTFFKIVDSLNMDIKLIYKKADESVRFGSFKGSFKYNNLLDDEERGLYNNGKQQENKYTNNSQICCA